MTVVTLYFFIGLLVTTYAFGKDREQFRDPYDDFLVVIVNFLFAILLWPVWTLICIDLAMDAEKAKSDAKKGK
jgi:hypothetical protein